MLCPQSTRKSAAALRHPPQHRGATREEPQAPKLSRCDKAYPLTGPGRRGRGISTRCFSGRTQCVCEERSHLKGVPVRGARTSHMAETLPHVIELASASVSHHEGSSAVGADYPGVPVGGLSTIVTRGPSWGCSGWRTRCSVRGAPGRARRQQPCATLCRVVWPDGELWLLGGCTS